MSKVICVGELLIDFVCTDKDCDLSNSVNFIKKAGGAPANVSVAIKKMGGEPCILGCVGNDPFGLFLEDTLMKNNVNTDYLRKTDEYFTTLAFVSLKSDGERDFKFCRGADQYYAFDEIDQSILEEAPVFHFGSATAFLGGDLEKTYERLLEYGITHDKIISFDPNYREAFFAGSQEAFVQKSFHFIKHSHVLKVSDEEAYILTGENEAEAAARKLQQMGARYVLVTLGNKGTLFCHQGGMEYVPVEPVKMIDATGAGDAFIGAVLAKIAVSYGHASEMKVSEMIDFIQLGNRVGALTVQRYGAMESIPGYAEVVEYIEK